MNSVTNLKENQNVNFTPLLGNEDTYHNRSSVKKEVKMFEASDMADEHAISIRDQEINQKSVSGDDNPIQSPTSPKPANIDIGMLGKFNSAIKMNSDFDSDKFEAP